MSSASETGFAINAANFEDLISLCVSYGTKYAPSNPVLSIASLNHKNTDALNALQQFNSFSAANSHAVNLRHTAFEGLKTFATTIVNALAASEGISQLTIDDAKNINRKMQGGRAKAVIKKDTPANGDAALNGSETTTAVKHLSVSQLSFDSQVSHFQKLIEVVSLQPTYLPNEIEKQTSSLKAKAIELNQANSKVIESESNLSNAKMDRDKILYGAGTGLVPLAMLVKKYVLSVYSASSPQYKNINTIAFRTKAGS